MPDYKIGGKRGLPLDADRPFDRQAAADSMFAAAGWPDNPDPAKARRGFVVYDASVDSSLKGGYHLPFCRVVDGTLKAVPNGVRNAKSRLPQLGGVSQEVIDRGNALLDSYMERIHEEADGGSNSVPDHLIAVNAARLTPVVAERATDEMLDRVHKQAFDITALDGRSPYFLSAEVSNNRLDAYFTKMHPTTLKNFAQDAESGVALMHSHIGWELPIGRSIGGRFTGGQGNGVARTLADFYVVPGMQLGSVPTDQVIDGIRTGVLRDVSVGFYSGQMFCALCGRSLWDYECHHVPGLSYPVVDKKSGETTGEEQAWAWIKDARLAEVSIVYDGATPGAGILKAQQMADAGRLTPMQARVLEAQFRTRLNVRRYWAATPPVVAAPGDEFETDDGFGEPDGQPQEERTLTEIQISEASFRLIRSLAPADLGERADPADVAAAVSTRFREVQTEREAALNEAREAKSEAERLRPLEAKVAELSPLADVGRTYRADLIEDTLDEGVAAEGNAFPREMWNGVLGRSTLEEIKVIRATFTAKADAKAGGGGRKINDRPGNPPKDGEGDDSPISYEAYRKASGR